MRPSENRQVFDKSCSPYVITRFFWPIPSDRNGLFFCASSTDARVSGFDSITAYIQIHTHTHTHEGERRICSIITVAERRHYHILTVRCTYCIVHSVYKICGARALLSSEFPFLLNDKKRIAYFTKFPATRPIRTLRTIPDNLRAPYDRYERQVAAVTYATYAWPYIVFVEPLCPNDNEGRRRPRIWNNGW